jgi:hypothetical protein
MTSLLPTPWYPRKLQSSAIEETAMPMILRSVLAVLGGFLTMAIGVMLFTGVFKMLALSWFAVEGVPTAPYLAVNVAYSFVAALAGGYVAAWIAVRLPVQHALALGGFVVVMSTVSAMHHDNRQPRLYQVTLAVLMPFAVLLGGYVRSRQS